VESDSTRVFQLIKKGKGEKNEGGVLLMRIGGAAHNDGLVLEVVGEAILAQLAPNAAVLR
jgi:hypothetical protein